MTKHYRQRLVAVIALSFLSFTSPLLLTRNAAAEKQSASKASSQEINSLIKKLKSNDEREINAAIKKLRKIGKSGITALIEALQDKNLLVHRSAAEVLKQIGRPAIPALVKALKNSDVNLRRRAINVLSVLLNSSEIYYDFVFLDVGSQSSFSLKKVGAEAQAAVPEIIRLLKDSDAGVRGSAASVLGNIGAEAKTAVPQLVPLLKDSDENVRSSTASALGNIGAEAKAEAKTAVPQLVPLLKDSDENVRSSTASALGNIGAEAKAAVSPLIVLLKDSDAGVRSSAAEALGQIGAESKTAVPQLVLLLKDSDAGVRSSAAFALGQISAECKTAVPQLVLLLKDSDTKVRSSAAFALGNIGADAKIAMPQLILLLKDSDVGVRIRAAYALGSIGAEAKIAMPQLVSLLKDSDTNVRKIAVSALEYIALSLQEKVKTLTSPELNQAVSNLESALKILAEPKADLSQSTIANLRVYINVLKAEQNARLFNVITQNKWVAATIIYLIFFPSLWLAILRLRPLWLLRINDALKPYEFKLPETLGGAPVRTRDLTFFSCFLYRPRVLDAWVSAHIKIVREQFSQIETVKSRAIYIPVAFELDDKKVPELRGEDLQSIFTKKRFCLLIWGEGGIGKTSIACQIADRAMAADKSKRLCKHLMIPILIEQLGSESLAAKHPFLEAISGQLTSISNYPTSIERELLQHLLQQRRILVITDHFSEMAETTQKEINPNSPDFPVNALVVTSRLDSTMRNVPKTTIHPLRIEGSELSAFMEKYLEKLGKLHLFNGSQFHYVCGDLAKLLEEIRIQGRSTTVLFAKLYADVLIAKMEGVKDQNLPQNIPDLMLEYVKQLNRDVAENKLTNRTVYEDAQLLAWECLKLTYRPASTKIKDAINALSVLNSQNAEQRLNYLEEKLHLLQTNLPSQENVRFVLDPVAEYLAGLHLVENYDNNESKWRDFLIDADFQNAPEAIKGFMFAVRDCYLAKIPDAKDTDFLPQQITSRYNVTITAVAVSP
ncbi:MAG: HEAT repeat domain-containing protein [Microcoleus sp.]